MVWVGNVHSQKKRKVVMTTQKTGVTLVALLASVLLSASVLAGNYPSSSDSSKHTWSKMGNNPYSGGIEEACSLVGLSIPECAEYQRLRAGDTCTYMDVPNGVVLDKLIFTKGGKDIVQNDVKVALTSAPTRRSRVCGVGGKAVISFDGCNNLAAVGGKPAPRAYRETTLRGGCPLGEERFIAISMYAPEVAEHECSSRFILSHDGRIKRPEGVEGEYDGNGLDEDRLSRTCGGELHRSGAALGALNHGFEVVIHENDGSEYLAFQGSIRGRTIMPSAEFADSVVEGHIRIPDYYASGVMEIRFDDYGKVASPTAFHIRERVEKLGRGCDATMFSAIERNTQDVVQTTQDK
jgi:hypothetical protein